VKRIAAVIFGIFGLGICLFGLIPSLQTIGGGESLIDDSRTTFPCQVIAEHTTLKLGEEQNIIVFAQDTSGEAMANASGMIVLEYPSGFSQKTYLPPTGEDGLSEVSFSILEEYFDGEVGRVNVRVELDVFNMYCEAETTFLVWY
jgi:hypothetical protein